MTSPQPVVIDGDALKYILSLPQGRAVIWDLFTAYGLYANPFHSDSAEKDFRLGMHNAALILYADCMTVSPDLTSLMFREQGTYDNDAGKPTQSDARSGSGPDSSSDSGSSPADPGLGLGRTGPTITDLGGD